MDTDDFGEFIFNTKSGFNISIHIDLFTKKNREFFQVTCEKGTLNWDIGQRTIYAEFDEKKELIARGDDYNLMYVNEINYFIAQVKNNGSLPGPHFEDGLRVMEIIEAIRKSDSNQMLIHV
jgi:predicted dehydrogenase